MAKRLSSPREHPRGSQGGDHSYIGLCLKILCCPVLVFVTCFSLSSLFWGYELTLKVTEKFSTESFYEAKSHMNQITATRVPSFTMNAKENMSHWDFSSTESCQVVRDVFLVMGMRVPKSASSTVQDLIDILAPVNRFTTSNVIQHRSVGRSRKVDLDEEESRLCTYLIQLPRRTVHTAHIGFLDFAKKSLPRPVYFATMRDPISRLISHYNYVHFGPRGVYVLAVRHTPQQFI
mmetsp:Transcript_5102/g.8567  ORF Transcript_5102/g.8567 Transcript_5102/m.8567 type:complete len:234 (+) Transcript_5102:49-750(+)